MKRTAFDECVTAIEKVDKEALERNLAKELLTPVSRSDLLFRAIRKIESCYIWYKYELEIFKVLLQEVVLKSRTQSDFDNLLPKNVLAKCISTIVYYDMQEWFWEVQNENGFSLFYFLRGSQFENIREQIARQHLFEKKSTTELWKKVKQITEGRRSAQEMFEEEIRSDQRNFWFIQYLIEKFGVKLGVEDQDYLREHQLEEVLKLFEREFPAEKESSGVLWKRLRDFAEGRRSAQEVFREEISCEYHNFPFISYLVENYGLVFDYYGQFELRYPLHVLLRKGKFEVVEYLVEKGSDVNVRHEIGEDGLFDLVVDHFWELRTKEISRLEELTKDVVETDRLYQDLDCEELSRLVAQLRSKKLKIWLGALDYRGWCFIAYLDRYKNFNLLEETFQKSIEESFLKLGNRHPFDIRKGYAKDGTSVPLLFYLSRYAGVFGCPELEDVIIFYLQQGADPSQRDSEGNTLLRDLFWSERCCRVILEKGADPNALNVNGVPAYHQVFWSLRRDEKLLDMLKLLVSHGADFFLKPPRYPKICHLGVTHRGEEIALDLETTNVVSDRKGPSKEVIAYIAKEMQSRITKTRTTVMCMQKYHHGFFNVSNDMAKMIALKATEEHSRELYSRIDRYESLASASDRIAQQ